LAMLFREQIAAAKRHIKLQIFASDVDSDAVAVARNGIYPMTIEAEVSRARLDRFFSKENDGYKVSADLRESIVFTMQDILSDPPFSRLDLVSCRNLLIYLGPEAQAKVVSLFHFALREVALLLLGTSETVSTSDTRFEVLSKPERLYKHTARSRPGSWGSRWVVGKVRARRRAPGKCMWSRNRPHSPNYAAASYSKPKRQRPYL
jgi:two-component system, chemotaxis family, CheB/CheR fusion protein